MEHGKYKVWSKVKVEGQVLSNREKLRPKIA
jgi:hypothetical protein